MKHSLALPLLLALCGSHAIAKDFYDASKEVRSLVKDVVADFGAVGDGEANDSQAFQDGVDALSAAGGGVLEVPEGKYRLGSVYLKSNVHIEIDHRVVLTPVIDKPTANTTLFNLYTDDDTLENVSVRGVGGKYTVDFPEYEAGIKLFAINNVRNFYIANYHVNDTLTRLSTMNLAPSGIRRGPRGMPINGTIENLSVNNAHYGYGLIQVQAAKSVFFKDLHGVGGVTLRLETGDKPMNDAQYGGVDNIYGENISCKDGNSAVMLSPHAMKNGVAKIDGVKAEGCGFAVRVGNGFVSKKQKVGDLEPGTFAAGTSVKNVHAVYGTNAQLKSKHFKYMPTNLRGMVQSIDESEDGHSVRGPSIAPMLYVPNYEVAVANVTGEGFEYVEPIVRKPFAEAKKGRGKKKKAP